MNATQNLLFEEDGAFKVGTIMADAGASLQVEHASGRRVKIKSAQVMLRFDKPAPAELLASAQRLAQGIDLDFLWQCAPQDEFNFIDLAKDYFGGSVSADQSTALLLALHAAPVYFHRKGRGRYRPAPAEILKVALAAVERKRVQEQQVQADASSLAAGQLPESIARAAVQLIVKPDKQSLEYRALERACAIESLSPERLLLRAGAFASVHDLHRARFIYEYFAAGAAFPERGWQLPQVPDLPIADVQAFSIDDSTTTEIDDCLSVSRSAAGAVCVGIHIAAPALAIQAGDPVDRAARERMSTVYTPAEKITMLADSLVAQFSLDAGRQVPAVSLYVELDDDYKIVATRSCAERIRVAANLRHDQLDALVTEQLLESAVGAAGAAQTAAEAQLDAQLDAHSLHGQLSALRTLWRLTLARSAERDRVRGKPEARFRTDFSFYVDGDDVRIVQRRRDAPLDRIVAEMMILANSEWGRMLAARKVPGIYRSQQAGKVRTSTHPMPHQGLGVEQYMWTTSPLRRYVDLVNQRQVLALLENDKPPFDANDAELFAIMSAFDARYAAYSEYQTRMERYWCLRWLAKQPSPTMQAVVIRDELVRLADAPFYFRMAQLPPLAPGRRIEVEILERDEISLDITARFVAVAANAQTEAIDLDNDDASALSPVTSIGEPPIEPPIEQAS